MDDASPPCLVYLFADRLLPKEGHWQHAMGEIAVPVPGTDTLVALGALERYLLAVTVWSLDFTKAIRLRQDPNLRRGQFGLEPGEAPVEQAGLAGRLLAALPAGGASLRDLVMDCWVGDDTMPLNALVLEAQLEAVDLGVIDLPETPELIPGFLGHHTFPKASVNKRGLRGQQAGFKTLAKRWSRVKDDQGTKDLLKECSSILYDARPSARPWMLP